MVTCTSLALLTLLSLAQDTDLLLQGGQELPGYGTVHTIGDRAVNSSGSWACFVIADSSFGPLLLVRDDGTIAGPGDSLGSYQIPANATGVTSVDLSESGDIAVIVQLGVPGSDVVWNGQAVLKLNDPLLFPGLPAGASFYRAHRVLVSDGGKLAISGSLSAGNQERGFRAKLEVDSAGNIVSFDLLALQGEVTPGVGLELHGLVLNEAGAMEMDPQGQVAWVDWFVGGISIEQHLMLDHAPLVSPGDSGPIPGSVVSPYGIWAGLGADGSWSAIVTLTLANGDATKVVLRDGNLLYALGDQAPNLPGARHRSFERPLAPLAGGGALHFGAIGYKIGMFEDDQPLLLYDQGIDGIPSGYFLGQGQGAASPDGRYSLHRVIFSSFEGLALLDRLGTPEDPCAEGPDDWEDNDTCAQARALVAGEYPLLSARVGDPDWYSVSVPDGQELSVFLRSSHAECDLDLRVYEGDCGAPVLVDSSLTDSDNERCFVLNQSGSAADYWVEVRVDGTGSGTCGRYRMHLAIGPVQACSSHVGPDDALEDNDSAAAPGELPFGSYSALHTSEWDEDWYRLRVPPTETVTVTLNSSFPQNTGGVASLVSPSLIERYDSTSITGSFGNSLSWRNSSGFEAQVLLRVESSFAQNDRDTCWTYELDVSSTNISLGTSYCPPTVNSTGGEGHLFVGGSRSVAANNLRFIASSVPDGMGLFFYGGSMQQLPVANGFLCVAPGAAGLHRLGPSMSQGGLNGLALDLDAPPSAAGQITVGSSWNFQFWYRDPAAGGGGANFTEAVTISFLP